MTIYNNVMSTSDIVRGVLESLGLLLGCGVQVKLMYSDRDYICNCLSGERTSLAISSTLSRSFKRAGYANITTNSTYTGGVVRKFGNLSFSRVLNAAHKGTNPRFHSAIPLSSFLPLFDPSSRHPNNSQYPTTSPKPPTASSRAPYSILTLLRATFPSHYGAISDLWTRF
jgi:carboxypeptidase D